MAKDILEKLFDELLSGAGAANSVARKNLCAAIAQVAQPESDATLADLAAHLDAEQDSGGDAVFVAKLASDPNRLHEFESAQDFVGRISRDEEPVPASLLRLAGAEPVPSRVVRLDAPSSRRISLHRKPLLLWGGAIAAMIIAGVTAYALRDALDRGQPPLAFAPAPQTGAANQDVATLPSAPDDAPNSTAPQGSGAVNPPNPISSHAVEAGDYPPESVQFQEQGTVKVKYLVLKDGTVGKCQVEIPSGFARLDDAACTLVRRWLFKPATTRDGSAVEWWMDASVLYRLRNPGLAPPPLPPATAFAAPRSRGIDTKNETLVKAINDAQAAAKAQNWAVALEKAKEADAIKDDKPAALNPIIHEMIISYAINARDFATALAQLEKNIAAGEGNRLQNLKQALGVAIATKDRKKTDQYARELGNNLDNETRLFIASTMMNAGRLKEALEYAKPALEGNASEAALKFEQVVYFKLNDQAGLRTALEQLLANYPNPEYLRDLLQHARNEKGLNDEQLMDIYRLRLITGDLKTAEDYTDMAQEALVAGYPAEAKQVLDKANAANLLSGDRAARLVKMVNDRAAVNEANITNLRNRSATDPNAGIALGMNYWSAGQYADAEAAIRSAISSGNLADPDRAKMALGHVLLSEGKTQEAIATFRSSQNSPVGTMIASLWAGYSGLSKSSGATAATGTFAPANSVASALPPKTAAAILRPAIAQPLNEATKAVDTRDFATALAKVQQADSVVGKTSFEEYQVAKYLGFLAINQPKPDYAAAARAYNREVASGGVPQAEKASMYNVAMRLNYQMRNFPEVIRDAVELQKLQPLDDTGHLILLQSYYHMNDFANAAATARKEIATRVASGMKPSPDVLALLEKSEAALKNAPSVQPIALTSHAVTADDYPPVSIRLEEQGRVRVKYLVTEDGSVGECTVIQSSGKTRLDDAACTMIKNRWLFKPAMRNGKPVAEYLTAEIAFQLK